MKTIWKFPLEVVDKQILRMPMQAEHLSVQRQRDQICLWSLVDKTLDMQEYLVEVVGTGHPMPPGDRFRKYVGTVQVVGELVWHVFITPLNLVSK